MTEILIQVHEDPKAREAFAEQVAEDALYGGWVTNAGHDGESDTYWIVCIEGDHHDFTAATVMTAMHAIAFKKVEVNSFIRGEVIQAMRLADFPPNWDASVTDAVIQVAIFGEVVYG